MPVPWNIPLASLGQLSWPCTSSLAEPGNWKVFDLDKLCLATTETSVRNQHYFHPKSQTQHCVCATRKKINSRVNFFCVWFVFMIFFSLKCVYSNGLIFRFSGPSVLCPQVQVNLCRFIPQLALPNMQLWELFAPGTCSQLFWLHQDYSSPSLHTSITDPEVDFKYFQ